MEQTRLFEVQNVDNWSTRVQWVPVETPAARATDPETSHEAAREVTASGLRSRQQQAVLALIRKYPGRTAVELAKHHHPWLPADQTKRYYAIQRRVSELEPRYAKRGEIRKSSNRRRAVTWWPAEGGPS